MGLGTGVGVGAGVGVGVGFGLLRSSLSPLLLLPLMLLPLLEVDVGVGVGIGIGVGVGVGFGAGVGNAETVDVVNLGVAPVPRTQARGGVQGLLAEMLLPSALQELLAACTMESRRLFKPFCKDAVPCGVFEASAATGEQAVGSAPLTL